MRINKYLSQIGICSRREADKLVDSRRVKVNEEIAILGTKIKEGDKITIDTPPLILLDRLTRLGVNRLFTARSSQQFHLELTDAVVNSYIKALDGDRKQEQKVPKRGVIGIGAGAYYTLYDVGSDKTHFLNVLDQPKSNTRGFG